MTDEEYGEDRMKEMQAERRLRTSEMLAEVIAETHAPYDVVRALLEVEIARYQLEQLNRDEAEGLYANPIGQTHVVKVRADASARLERHTAEAVRLDDDFRERFLKQHRKS